MVKKRKLRPWVKIVGILLFLILTPMIGKALEPNDEEVRSSILEKFEVVEIEVKEGQRAFNIQQDLTPNKNALDMLYMASHYFNNGKEMGEIVAGETIYLLKDKDEK